MKTVVSNYDRSLKTTQVLFLTVSMISIMGISVSHAQQSVAHKWNEALLFAIRKDFARPTIHARNLFHTSAAMYDAWAAYDQIAETYMIGKTVNGFTCPYNGIPEPSDVEASRNESISFAAYRVLRHRFQNSPGAAASYNYFDSLMTNLGYDMAEVSVDYSTGGAAQLGNFIAENVILFGQQDGSNEQLGYTNQYYTPYNNTLLPVVPGNPNCIDANRWQPLTLAVYVDQNGQVLPVNTPAFQSPEWGMVAPFSLTEDDLTIHQRDGNDWWVYHDPGVPALLNVDNVDAASQEYKWNFNLVSIWQSHLDTSDGVMWDISPASVGNIQSYPNSIFDYSSFYNAFDGGDTGEGYAMNPKTGLPYEPQLVRRGDYTRVLAEFWADGPNSETPPGHWFTIFNKVSGHPLLEKRFMGQGEVLGDLEWDVKGYFALGGGMHDAAITAWGIKGYYDYLRPISAIRYMADLGQSTNTEFPNYHPAGIPLIPGFIELVEEGDPLAADSIELVGKIKLFTWRGPSFIDNPQTDMAGVGWILAEHWWPYQRPTFVTPPFAGYISGHSTFSRTAAEVMTLLTGDPYFPGGMSEFLAPQNQFLKFEEGPSTDVILQWATYRDASDQCSLSRIWGGIHPPMDDIPGRLIGQVLGPEAFNLARTYFEGTSIVTELDEISSIQDITVYPNPVSNQIMVHVNKPATSVSMQLIDVSGKLVKSDNAMLSGNSQLIGMDVSNMNSGIYMLRIVAKDWQQNMRVAITH
jgi:membrane-associated phospholipid phosphatase